jgi:hypothetical protein
MEIYPLWNQVFNMATIMSGNFFNMNCDAVDHLTAHILSYLVTGWMISAFNSTTVCGFFRKIFSLGNPKESRHMSLNQDYSWASSAHMWNDQEIGLRLHTSQKCHVESPKQHLLCVAWLHPAWTTEFVIANL